MLAPAFMSLRAVDPGALSAMAQSIGYLLAAVGPVVFGLLHTAGADRQVPRLMMCLAAACQTPVALVAGRGTVRTADGADQTSEPVEPAPERAPSPGP